MLNSNSRTVRPDSKGRICLGKEFTTGVSRFEVTQDKKGRLILEPYTEIPLKEKWLYNNKDALNKVTKGLSDSAKGKISSRGDFSQYLEKENEI